MLATFVLGKDEWKKKNCAELTKQLNVLANEEKYMCSYYQQCGSEIVQEVCELLKTKKFRRKRLSIAKVIVAGSMGKNTSLGISAEPDFDIILCLNDVKPPLKNAVNRIYNILADGNIAGLTDLKKNRNSVQFSAKKTIKLPNHEIKRVNISCDLVPAANLSLDMDKQVFEILEMISKTANPEKDWYAFSSSLSEATAEYVKLLPQFDHLVITLAKMWNEQLIKIMEKLWKSSDFSGRSSLVEIVAIQAAKQNQGNTLNAFRRFLNLMRKFENIDVDILEEKFKPWDNLRHQLPFIRDFVNPYNNYAIAVDAENKKYFKHWAAKTRKELNIIARKLDLDCDSDPKWKSWIKVFFGK